MAKKMDRYLVNRHQSYELAWVCKKMMNEGIFVTAAQVDKAVQEVGVSRRAVYRYLRNKYS